MRPLKLILKGFKPFKTRQEIDFSKLNFFVIRGPTGSGKSSILEAMVFALFGEPTEKLNHDELVNKNSGGFYIDFTFSVRGTVYRIERLRRLGKGGEARFYVNGVRRAIRSDAIKREIQNLLGVTATQFKKIFFLPQGRYAEFFNSEPRQRRELIVSLLELDIYKRLGERIKEEWEKVSKEIAKIEGELKALEEYTPEQRGKFEEEKQTLEVEKQNLEKLLEETRKKLNELRELEKLYRQKEELERQLQTLEGGEYSNLKEEVENLKPLRELLPLLERYLLRANELKNLQKEKQDLIETIDRLEKELKTAQGELEKLHRKREELKNRQGEVEELKKHLGVLNLLEPKFRELKKLKGELQTRKEKLKAKLEELKKVTSELKRVEENLLKTSRRLEQINYSPEREAQVRFLLQRAKEKGELLTKFQRLKDTLLRLERGITSLKGEVKKAEEKLKEVENLLKGKEREFSLYLLTKDLKEGDPCPICGKPLTDLKTRVCGDIDLDEIKKLQEQEEALRKALEEKNRKLQALEVKREEVLSQLKETEQKLSQMEEVSSESELKGELENLLALKGEREKLEKLLKELEEGKTALASKKASLEGEINSERQALERDEKHLTAWVEEVKQTLRGIYQSLNLKPPKDKNPFLHLKEVLNEKISSFEREKEELLNLLTQKEKRVSQLSTALEREKSLLHETERKIANLLEELNHLKGEMTQKGWKGGEPSLLLEKLKNLPQLEEKLKKLEEQISVVKANLKKLGEELKGIDPETLKEIPLLEQKLTLLEGKLSQTLSRLGFVKEKLTEFDRKLELKSRLEETFNELRQREVLLKTLKDDFRSDRLIDFVVNRAVEDIVTLAGEYLFNLSQRYRFVNRGGEIFVLDLFEDTQRNIKTLSGGETFLASLSFALALGDYVGSGGGVESLFIDEGFGTLDKEKLEKIGELFEKLKLSLNKVVGVVTHLEELAEYFDQRIEVIPSAEGSKIRVVNG
ncbi:MAG: hypothetical protein DSZ31_06770 [Gammaproteobacteria bacterium]|nr:MAG: hypothetical protein DSZ31_06770 [Gammaproteobacteria bacterium]